MTKVRSLGLAAVLLLVVLVGCRSAQTTSAILYIEQKQYDKAVKVLHEGLSYNPDEADAYFYLGEAHSKLAEDAIGKNNYADSRKNYELAYKYYNRAKEIEQAKFGEQVRLALLHNYTLRSNDAKNEFSAKSYEPAEGYFRLAYAALPDSIAPIKNIARMKMKQAEELLNDPKLVDTTNLKTKTDTLEFEKRKAQVDTTETKLLNEALDLVNQVLKARPDAYELQVNKATVLSKLGRAKDAQEIYDQLLKDHPTDTGLLVDMANLAVDQGNFERAAELYVKLADLMEKDSDPSNDDQIKTLQVQAAGWLAQKQVRRYPEAIELYKKAQARELIPERDTLFGLLEALYSQGDVLKSEAASDSTKKADLTPKYLALFKEGADVGSSLVEQYPEAKFGYYFLGLCQVGLGDNTAAEVNLRKFQELESAGTTP